MIIRDTWLFVGVVLWGIPTALFASLILAFIDFKSFPGTQIFHLTIFIKYLIILAPLFIFLGVLIGILMFHISRNAINQYKKNVASIKSED